MQPRSLSLARLTALGALLLGLSLGCGGSEPPPPPSPPPPTPPVYLPDAVLSTVEVSRASDVWADGQDGSAITVTVRDTWGGVMAGVPVELDVAEPGATVQSPEGVTDRRGVMKTWLTATSPGVKTVRASVRGAEGRVVIANRPTVKFRRVAGMVFEPLPETVGVRTSMAPVRVRFVDDEGATMPVSERAVTLSLRGGAGTLPGDRRMAWSQQGIATFQELWVDAEGTGYTIVAWSPDLPDLPEVSSSAFDVVDDIPPGTPVMVEGDITRTSIQVEWVAVGDDYTWGTATTYDLRYATSRITSDEDFAAATRVPTDAPQAPGTREAATITGLVPGTTYYVALKVTDSAGNSTRTPTLWRATLAEGVTQLAFRPQPAGGVAGEVLPSVQVALLDANGAPVTEAVSPVTLSVDGDETLRWTARPRNGVATFSDVRITRAGTQLLHATIGPAASVTSIPFTIRSAAVSRLGMVGVPGPVGAGISNLFEVSAFDAFGNRATDYTGTVRFTSTDAQAVLPPETAYTPVHEGRRFFEVTLRTAGRHTVTVTDGTRTDSLTLDVRPGLAASVSLSGLPASVTAGTEQAVTVTLRDAWGNLASGYGGTVAFTSSDARAVLPGLTDFTPEDAGRKTFRVRFLTAGANVSLRVEDRLTPELNATARAQVVAAAPAGLVLSAPESTTAGQTFPVIVTAQDEFGNRATGYTGTVRFSAPGANATLPPQTAFTASDAGRKTFASVVLRRAGRTELTVTDTVSTSRTATASVNVTVAAPARLGFSLQPQNGRVRTALAEVRVAVLDAFDNPTSASSPVVSLALSSGGSLGGTTTATPSSGVASFGALLVAQEGFGYTLRATAEGLDPALSAPFDIVDDIAPAKPVLSASAVTVSSLDLAWVAVGDDDRSGKATAYDLRQSTTPILTDADFAAATRVDTGLPQAPGAPERVTLRNLSPATAYHVALRVTDGAGNATRSDTLTVSTADSR
jgi:hypothetical protein